MAGGKHLAQRRGDPGVRCVSPPDCEHPSLGWGNIFSAQGLAQKLAQWVLVRCWSGEQALTPWPRVHFLICTFPD